MPVSQAVLTDHTSFHSASRARRLHSPRFQQNHPIPAVSETTSAYSQYSHAILSIPPCVLRGMFGKNILRAVLIFKSCTSDVLTDITKIRPEDLDSSSQPGQALFSCILCRISYPRRSTGSIWDSQDSESTVALSTAHT